MLAEIAWTMFRTIYCKFERFAIFKSQSYNISNL